MGQAELRPEKRRRRSGGFTYGASIGYDYQTPSGLIIGAEASLDDTSTGRSDRNDGSAGYSLDARRDPSASERVDLRSLVEEATKAARLVGSDVEIVSAVTAVCRSIVRAHGGDVRLRNSPAGFVAELRVPLIYGNVRKLAA